MTAITSVLGQYGIPVSADEATAAIGSWLWKKAKEFFKTQASYGTSISYGSGIEDHYGLDGFEHVGQYNGKPVYAGSNSQIAKLLNRYSAPGHASGKENYGTALDGMIFIRKELVDGLNSCERINPLYRNSLENIAKYVLDHEYAHTTGAGEKEAHGLAEETTGLKFDRSTGEFHPKHPQASLTIAQIGGFI